MPSTRIINKILIANRGEISCRVSRTAQGMGIRTVAVFCDAERVGKHVLEANEAYRLGPPPAITSYLLGDKIIEVAKQSGAQAIHPGYGFLSENADFAEAVTKAGLEFIGPPPSAIRAMGSKSESKIIMMKANVPVLEGYNGDDQRDELLLEEAKKIGFPVLIKAVMGGGGKGMKLVLEESEFLPQLQSARREAINFFKDDRVIIERYVTTPRHIEVQVMCDKHGNGFYFFERDCSVQRRHQKVLEECPAQIPRDVARTMGEVAVRAAKAVGYVGAGTVEFIYDAAVDKYYFMEMNTRLQVEHPVTEEAVRVKGEPLDLVRLQILVAQGEKLPFTQDDITIKGHAIEARVYAESPKDGFLPGSGKLRFVEEPSPYSTSERKIRIDTGFRSGDEVLIYYDPMIAKVIAWGKDRATALDTLNAALRDYHIIGIPTNIEFLNRSLEHTQFKQGGVTTKFIEENKDALLSPSVSKEGDLALVASVLMAPRSQGALFPNFRLNHSLTRILTLTDSDKKVHTITCSVTDNTLTVQGKTFSHTIELTTSGQGNGVLNHSGFLDNKSRVSFRSVQNGNVVALLTKDGTKTYTISEENMERVVEDTGVKSGVVASPINGKVVKLCFAAGSSVTKGQTILILEAMKMEHNVKAPCDGVVSYFCKEKGMVAADSKIANIVPPS